MNYILFNVPFRSHPGARGPRNGLFAAKYPAWSRRDLETSTHYHLQHIYDYFITFEQSVNKWLLMVGNPDNICSSKTKCDYLFLYIYFVLYEMIFDCIVGLNSLNNIYIFYFNLKHWYGKLWENIEV